MTNPKNYKKELKNPYLRKGDIAFYLDPFELLNKPRRLFTGLQMEVVRKKGDYSDEEKMMALEMIDEMEKHFYEVIYDKFDARIREEDDARPDSNIWLRKV